MDEPIRGRVAKVLNTRELALNIGSTSGVKVGMLFDILDPNGYDIRDPDTMEILGSIERPKVRVKVIQVLEQLSVASTFKAEKINIGGSFDLGVTGRISDLLRPPQYVTKYETLKTDEKTWEDLDESESYVKTGDPVVSVREVPTEVVDNI
jgi:hypothetical protein